MSATSISNTTQLYRSLPAGAPKYFQFLVKERSYRVMKDVSTAVASSNRVVVSTYAKIKNLQSPNYSLLSSALVALKENHQYTSFKLMVISCMRFCLLKYLDVDLFTTTVMYHLGIRGPGQAMSKYSAEVPEAT